MERKKKTGAGVRLASMAAKSFPASALHQFIKQKKKTHKDSLDNLTFKGQASRKPEVQIAKVLTRTRKLNTFLRCWRRICQRPEML